MAAHLIVVQDLSKTYHVPEREDGLGASLRKLVRRTYRPVQAVTNISFQVEAGEMVGFIGPNGAGKTTTLKMLCGLLYPTAGKALVAGHVPWERRTDFLRQISMVMGNKGQMLWDIPPLDTFRVLGEIYRVPPAELNHTLDELVDLLDMRELLAKPVRNLSLGERMKCELVGALLHRPRVLFLDEPTLGLDVSMQRRLRRFIREYNQRSGATVILTSHYMVDVVELCPRVLVIHHGRLIYDGNLNGLVEQLAPFKLIRITLDRECPEATLRRVLPPGLELLEWEKSRLTLRARRPDTPSVTAQLLSTLPVIDLGVEEPPVEAVIDRIYQEGK
jgi:ABC-2 type transport system ATP-binding protein